MTTRNMDSSYLTMRRNAMALSSYNSALQTAVNAGTSVRREQPSGQVLTVITERKQGTCFCTDINNGNVYNNNAPGACGCRG